MKATIFIIFIGFFTLISCKNQKQQKTTITVTNNLNLSRTFETVEIPVKTIKKNMNFKHFSITDDKGVNQISQEVDTNNDGEIDFLLFQPQLKPKETKKYFISQDSIKINTDKKNPICYSRFVPERIDDYAWENDRVAFRVYGPVAQKMIENGDPNGTLSSGVDCWLKRVKYPIINKWYKKYADKTGTYHKDTGEGLDNYHVGKSRGCGGIAVKTDSTYAVSKNFIKYKTITTGPIRTQFNLEYANWNANGKLIKESRIITLDKGSNLSKFEISLSGTDTISIGLTLHKNDGKISKNKKNGWISYWENLDDSELGTGIVIDANKIIGFNTYISKKNDDVKNQFMQVKIKNKKLMYYTGFGWKKSNQFSSNKEWNNYLDEFSKRISSPLVLTII